MSQSRDIINAIDKHLDNIFATFLNAFKEGDNGVLFEQFWGIFSPRHNMMPDAITLDTYYLGQIDKIPRFIKTRERDSCDISPEKQDVLKALGGLCYKLAKLKFAVITLQSCADPETFTLVRQDFERVMTDDIQLNPVSLHSIRQGNETLEQYFYLVGSRLVLLGYMRNQSLFGKSARYGLELSADLSSAFARLKDNNKLNDITQPLQDARKHKQEVERSYRELMLIIDEMRLVKNMLDEKTNQQLASYEQTILRVQTLVQHLTAKTRRLQSLNIDFEKVSKISLVIDECQYSGLINCTQSVSIACDKNRSGLSIAAMGMISDPWVESAKAVNNLYQIDKQLKQFVANYNGIDISLVDLQRRHHRLKEQLAELTKYVDGMQQTMAAARQAKIDYLQAIENTVMTLNAYIVPVMDDSLFGFTRRHWLKVLGGGMSGAAVGTLTLVVSTNPILLAVVISGAGVMGAISGAGGGLILDSIQEKRVDNKTDALPPDTAKLTNYGTFWRGESVSAAAMPDSSTVNQIVAKQNKP